MPNNIKLLPVLVFFILATTTAFSENTIINPDPKGDINLSVPQAKPIHIILNNWTSQIILAKITGSIFKHIGYKVHYVKASATEQWGALALGIDHVQIDVKEGSMNDIFHRMLAEKLVIDAGSHAAKIREGWWYPAYVEDLCPGLPNWQALNHCSHLFSQPGSDGLGVYVTGPWNKHDEARIRALELKFKVEPLATADELWLRFEEASITGQPIIIFNWSPNWIEARYKGKFIEFPVYSPECETDPGWGINPDFHHDCGNPTNGWLKKVAWAGMPTTWPCAYNTLKNISLNNSMIATATAEVDVDKLSYQEAADHWLSEYTTLWNNWIPTECRGASAE